MSAAFQLTLEEFLGRPDRDDDQREELIEGEVIVSPGARADHSEIVDRLRERLSSLRQSGYVLRNDFSCLLGARSMPVPDLAAVRKDRWEKAVKEKTWVAGSPELVIEVVSPTNRKLHRKAQAYLEHGAVQVWIVDPVKKTVSVITTGTTTEVRIGETLEFQNVQIPVAGIFPDSV